MDIAYPHIAERLFGRPHAIEPFALRVIMDSPLAQRVLSGEPLTAKRSGKKGRSIRRDRLAAIAAAEEIRSADGIVSYGLTAEGVAIVPVAGVLSRRFDWLAAACGFTTYDGLGATLDAVGGDFRVKALLFDVDSPGGEADGMLDIGDAILAMREHGKPIWAVANTLAASAAYAIAGSAETLYLPRLAQVGSIGCVTIHVDQSARDAALGLAYSAIYSGARKVDGWGHAPLSAPARENAQAGVDHVRDAFAALVGRQGRMSAKAASATEAAIYADQSAVDAGLADQVGTFADALAALTEQVSSNRGAFAMKTAATTATTAQHAAAAAQAAPAKPEAASAPAGAAAAGAATAVAAVAEQRAEMTPPEPGEECKLCGTVKPKDKASAEPAAAAAVSGAAPAAATYGAAEIAETISLCKTAKVPSAADHFIAAKTPIDTVRAQIMDAQAQAADDAGIVRVDTSGNSNIDRMASWKATQEARLAERGRIPRT